MHDWAKGEWTDYISQKHPQAENTWIQKKNKVICSANYQQVVCIGTNTGLVNGIAKILSPP